MLKGKVVIGIVLVSISGIVLATNMIPQKSSYYYELGGGSDLNLPPLNEHNRIKIGGSIKTNLGYSCNIFNPGVTIRNVMNNFGQSVEGLAQSLITSATAAIGSLPMYALEKTAPDMYNLIQNAMLGGQEQFDIGMKSCQTSLNQIRNHQSPYEDWFSISDSQGWLSYTKQATNNPTDDSKTDVTHANSNITKTRAEYGVPWVHEDTNAGGIGQPPINVISDVVKAGYNITAGSDRPLDSDAPPSNGEKKVLTAFWDKPSDAAQWSQLVLGDMAITAEQDETKQATMGGTGLVPLLTSCPAIGHTEKTCVTTVQDNLWSLVHNETLPTPDNLRQVSASSLVISPDVIRSIQNQSAEEQAISVSKLSEEVAIQNLMDEGLLLRRLLLIGGQVQAVLNIEAARKTVQTAVSQLDSDLHDMQFINQVRKDMLGNTLKTVLQDQSTREMQVKSESGLPDDTALSLGAHYKK